MTKPLDGTHVATLDQAVAAPMTARRLADAGARVIKLGRPEGDFARAYGLWSDGGRSSGQTPEQFAAGFADTARVEVLPGEPGDIEAAAGSRYVEIPVSVNATQRDGSVRKYIGSYVLRRAVVDGANAEQRAWRIGSAELREVRP